MTTMEYMEAWPKHGAVDLTLPWASSLERMDLVKDVSTENGSGNPSFPTKRKKGKNAQFLH
jgi:hypothetical protein